MGLKDNIKTAIETAMGGELNAQQSKVIDKLSEGIKDAVIEFLTEQTFTITEMKASVEVEDIKTPSSLEGDVKETTLFGPYAPVIDMIKKIASLAPGGSGLVGELESKIKSAIKPVASGGSSLPALDLAKTGGQGGVLQSTGHAYIGIPSKIIPNSDTTEEENDFTKVKLLEDNIVGE